MMILVRPIANTTIRYFCLRSGKKSKIFKCTIKLIPRYNLFLAKNKACRA